MFWPATNRAHVLYERRLEPDRLRLADYAPEAVRISAQPMWLCGLDGKTMRRHVPDRLPPAIATEDAVVLYEVSDPDNPDWANGEVLYGYASVDGYTVAVLGMNGEEFERQFTEFFTNAVLKVRDR